MANQTTGGHRPAQAPAVVENVNRLFVLGRSKLERLADAVRAAPGLDLFPRRGPAGRLAPIVIKFLIVPPALPAGAPRSGVEGPCVSEDVDGAALHPVHRQPAMAVHEAVPVNPPVCGPTLDLHRVVSDEEEVVVVDLDVHAARPLEAAGLVFVKAAIPFVAPHPLDSDAVEGVAQDIVPHDHAAQDALSAEQSPL